MILVTGGTGVMGSKLVKALVKKGWKVRALTLPNDPFVSRLAQIDCEIFYGDITDKASLKGAFSGIDTVYHLAAIIISYDPIMFTKVNVNGVKNVLGESISAGVKHFIHVSSVSVDYPKATPYSISKRHCETLIKAQTKINYTIVRPSLAYEQNGGQEFMMFLDYLKKYPVVPFIGQGRALKNPVHVADLIRGFISLAGNEKAYDKTYNFTGGEEISIWDLGHLMLQQLGIHKPFIPIPVWFCRGLAEVMGKLMKHPPLTWNVIAGITQDANLDHSEATADLGYQPIGISEGIKKCFPLSCQT